MGIFYAKSDRTLPCLLQIIFLFMILLGLSLLSSIGATVWNSESPMAGGPAAAPLEKNAASCRVYQTCLLVQDCTIRDSLFPTLYVGVSNVVFVRSTVLNNQVKNSWFMTFSSNVSLLSKRYTPYSACMSPDNTQSLWDFIWRFNTRHYTSVHVFCFFKLFPIGCIGFVVRLAVHWLSTNVDAILLCVFPCSRGRFKSTVTLVPAVTRSG